MRDLHLRGGFHRGQKRTTSKSDSPATQGHSRATPRSSRHPFGGSRLTAVLSSRVTVATGVDKDIPAVEPHPRVPGRWDGYDRDDACVSRHRFSWAGNALHRQGAKSSILPRSRSERSIDACVQFSRLP